MARRKVRLAYIINESQRKASYKKRKKGMLKKLDELTILCSVEAAAIMYSSFEQEPVVWLSVEGMQQTIARFKSLPNVQQTRRMVNQESSVQDRLQKLSTQLLKFKKDNREKEMTALMYRILTGQETIDSLSFTNLNDLGWVTNIHLAEIDSEVEAIMKNSSTPASTLAPTAPPATPAPTLAPFLSNARSVATASTPVLGQIFPQNQINLNLGTGNLVAPAGMFSQQNYHGNMGMQTPIFPNSNPGVAWDNESWAHFLSMMNNSNQNDPTQGGRGLAAPTILEVSA